MRVRIFQLALVAAFFPLFLFARAPFTPPESFADLVERLSPAVVNIATIDLVDLSEGAAPFIPGNSPFSDLLRGLAEPLKKGDKRQVRKPLSLGSGFIIDGEKGYIVTNHHVIKDADEILIILQNDKKLKAKLVGSDSRTDIALLKVNSKEKLPEVAFGDASEKVRVGDWVLTIGNPYGFGGTVTAGIVSARARNFGQNVYVDYIQTDAPINVGNSGGPMFDMQGNVVGVNTAIVSPTGGSIGIGFAVPSKDARQIVDEILQNGYVKRGWIGVAVQDVDLEMAKSLGMKKAEGALVLSIIPGGPAEKSGLKVSDVILEFDGKPIEQRRDLPRIVGDAGIDTTLPYIVWRDGKKKLLKVKIEDFDQASKKAASQAKQRNKTIIKPLGIAVRDIPKSVLERFHLESGVVVVGVQQNGPAAQKGIVPGDIIVMVDQKPVLNSEMFIKIIEGVKAAKKSSVLTLISHNGNRRFAAVPLL